MFWTYAVVMRPPKHEGYVYGIVAVVDNGRGLDRYPTDGHMAGSDETFEGACP